MKSLCDEVHLWWMKSKTKVFGLIKSSHRRSDFIQIHLDFIRETDLFRTCSDFIVHSTISLKTLVFIKFCFLQLNPPSSEEIHLRWMKSLRVEICLAAGYGGQI